MAIGLYDEYYPNCHSSFLRSITSAQIEKLRDRRASLEGGGHRELREFRELREQDGVGGAEQNRKS
jgi:hypothetical protein